MNEFVTSLNKEWLNHIDQFKSKIEKNYQKMKEQLSEDELNNIKNDFLNPLQSKYNDLTETYNSNFERYYRVSEKVKFLIDQKNDLDNETLLKTLDTRKQKEIKNYKNDHHSLKIAKQQLKGLANSLEMDYDYLLFKEKMVSVEANNQKKSIYVGNQKELPNQKVRDGYGYLTENNNQTIYFGSWRDGKRNGFGKQIFENGTLFMGKWKDDKPELGFLRIGIDDNLYYGSLTDGIVCRKNDESENGLEELLLMNNLNDADLTNDYDEKGNQIWEIQVVEPEGLLRYIESEISLTKDIS